MGQRLVIVLKKDNENVASCYWHNGGLTRNSIIITKKVVLGIKKQQDDYLEIFRNVDFRIKFNGYLGANRNIGLFDNSKEDIKASIFAAEQLVYIDIDTMLIDFKKGFEIEEKEEAIAYGYMNEESYETEILKYEDVTEKYLVPFNYEVLLELEKDFKDHQQIEKKWKTKDSVVSFVE